ncbi:MAG: TIGR03808 family TAT-translocated repetitive protein [bacterium]|nr:TIGR03808 family TAT-translocated repetitive protein [bacterium]
MQFHRRQIMAAGLGLTVTSLLAHPPRANARNCSPVQTVSASEFGLLPDLNTDQSKIIQRAIDETATKGLPLFLSPGIYLLKRIKLRSGSRLLGIPGQTILNLSGPDALLSADGGSDIALSGLIFDGNQIPLGKGYGLITCRNIKHFNIDNCRFQNSGRHGIAVYGCAGRISDVEVTQAAKTGIFSLDADGLEISHNHIHHCANNGIQIWRSSIGPDGTIVAHNRVEHIKAQDGGSGQNGNGINIFRADEVIVTGNRISNCVFSAIRCNAGSNIHMTSNSCNKLGEVALYAEFGSQGAIIANNIVDDAATGISVTNFNNGGRLAVVQGNIIRNLSKHRGPDQRGKGIFVEADTVITGNLVENAPTLGIGVGWKKYMRDVSVSNNIIRHAHIGIGITAHQRAGHALITGNMITGTQNGSIRAMKKSQPIGPDLSSNPSNEYNNLTITNNVSV